MLSPSPKRKRLGRPAVKARATTRTRRSPEDARAEILAAAERLLISRGPEAVRVQTVAREVGITDAAVHYHFGSRETLLEALLRHAGRRMKREINDAMARWDRDDPDIGELFGLMSKTYDTRGYARLSAWLMLTGWSAPGSGIFRRLAEEIHAQRVEHAGADIPPLDDTLFMIELLTLVAWAEALSGHSWRKSVGLPADRETRDRFKDWFAELVTERLGIFGD